MRTFLVSALLSFGGLAAGSVVSVQEPPAAPAPVPASPAELTPAEIELILHYVDLRNLEIKPHEEVIQRIWQRYDALIRKALPPEKHQAAKVYMGGC